MLDISARRWCYIDSFGDLGEKKEMKRRRGMYVHGVPSTSKEQSSHILLNDALDNKIIGNSAEHWII